MRAEATTEGNRYGTWALVLGIVCLLVLLAPAHAAVVVAGTALSITALVLGINGVLAYSRRRATNRPQAVAGIVLATVGTLLWLLAVVGMVFGLG